MIERRGKTWTARAQWRNGLGKKESRQKSGFKTKAAADEWIRQTLAEHQGITVVPGRETMTVRELHDEYVKRLKSQNKSPSTVTFYESCAKRFLPVLGAMRVRDVGPLEVQRTIDRMRTRDDGTAYRAASVSGVYRALRAEFNYAVRLEVIQASPCHGIDLPDRETHEATIYSGDELGALLGALRAQGHELYWPVSFSARNALRRGEALGVRWQDIDFAAGTLSIRANLTDPGSGIVLRRVKTASSAASVVIPEDFLQDLRMLRERRLSDGTYRLGDVDVPNNLPYDRLDPAEFVCLDKNGQPYRPHDMRTRLQRFQKVQGLPLSTWHDLRHTYGTLLAEAGVDVLTISKSMRHSGVGITADQYIAPTTQIARRATDEMDRIIQFPGRSGVH